MEWWEPAFIKMLCFFEAIPICKTQKIQSLAGNVVMRIKGENICNALSMMTEKVQCVNSKIYSHSSRSFSKHYVPGITLGTLENICLNYHKLQRCNSYYHPHFTAKEPQKVKYFLRVTLAANWWRLLLYLPHGAQFSNKAYIPSRHRTHPSTNPTRSC